MARSPLQLSIFPFWHWLTYGRLLLAGCWIVCLSIAVGRHIRSATEFDTDKRPPPRFLINPVTGENLLQYGNFGHMEVDFGAQWLMGRMIIRGYGQELYNRTRQRQVLNESFLIENEPIEHQLHRFPNHMRPADLQGVNLKSDAEMLLDWTVGSSNDSTRWPELGREVALAFAGGMHALAYAPPLQIAADSVPPSLAEDLSKPSCGGPLYPPVHALLYAPLGMIDDPRIAYYVFQLISTLSLFVAGFSVSAMTHGRIWTPVACAFLLLYPGYQPGLTLGQNHVVSLAVGMVGWALACRGRLYLGGLVWGLLAFKPVWAVAFGLVPLMMWRPRFLLGMATGGLGLVAATLPLVGIHGWKDWLANGKMATEVYNRNSNWINLSRDLSGIVRRLMLDLSDKTHELERNVPSVRIFGGEPRMSEADLVSWIVLFAVFLTTMIVYGIWGRPRKLHGVSAGFLFLGCYLCCFRFMYYDGLLSAIGVVALLAYPQWYLRSNQWELPRKETGPTARRGRMHINSLPLLLCGLMLLLQTYFLQLRPEGTIKWVPYSETLVTLSAAINYDYATDTILVIALWAWAGWKMIRGVERPEEAL